MNSLRPGLSPQQHRLKGVVDEAAALVVVPVPAAAVAPQALQQDVAAQELQAAHVALEAARQPQPRIPLQFRTFRQIPMP
jgi:hypothetical protein